MKFSTVKHDLENIRKALRPIIQVDMISYENDKRTITWAGREPGIYGNNYYPLEYQRLIDRRQYSLLLSDLSFFQFYYKFNAQEDLESAKICFYPCPTPLNSDEIDELKDALLNSEPQDHDDYLFNHVERLEELEIDPVNTSHIRFDYDSFVTSHEPSHLQFGGVNDLRLPANFYPLPTLFIEMVMRIIDSCPPIDPGNLAFAAGNKWSVPQNTLRQTITLSASNQ